MASTWSNLKIQLMGAGDESGTWGTVTNANLGTVIEEAITGSADVTFASADVTLTLTDSTASQTARNLRLNLTGTSGGARNLVVPAIEKFYVINNGLADAVTVKNSTGTGIAVPSGKTMLVFNNGTNVLDVITHLSSLTLGSALPAGSGGTGLTSPGASGNVLVSNGTAWTSGSGFPSGGIIMWSGTIATIPSGWYLCDGNNGTPDLRNKFVIAADADSGGSARTTVTGSPTQSGGSKDAIVVSHTHTATSSVTDPGHYHIMGTAVESTNIQYGNSGSIGVRTQNTGGTGLLAHTETKTTGITVSTTNTSTGSSGTNANLPPYFALAYIMKA